MTWREVAYVTIAIALFVTPLSLVVVLVVKLKAWRPDISAMRYRLWLAGFIIGGIATTSLPLFLSMLTLKSHSSATLSFEQFSTRLVFVALIASPVGALLSLFGRGRQRWVGFLSFALSFCELCVSVLASSY